MALQDLSYKDRHWHSDCFLCIKCSRSLVDRPFATKEDMLMCVECYSNEYSAKCHACLKTIMPGALQNCAAVLVMTSSVRQPVIHTHQNSAVSCNWLWLI